jgi:hypothetical protein
LGRQMRPPLTDAEINSTVRSSSKLERAFRRDTIDRWLGITDEERRQLDPPPAREQRKTRNAAIRQALVAHPELSGRRMAELLRERGIEVSPRTIDRRRQKLCADLLELARTG